MTIKNLLDAWNQDPPPALTSDRYSIRLNVNDAARLKALAELHPGTAEEQIVTDLLSAAIHEVEAAMPYVPGTKVIREDDHGDPVYEDTGMTPRFLALVRKHQKKLEEP